MNQGEYKRSLKLPASEELLDLVFYRPAAFVLVKSIASLPITPNQVTMASLAAGLAAAYAFGIGSRAGLTWGALFYLLANILDCADGQLARLQKSGTLLGRIVDGWADYISGTAVFVGVGIGLESTGAGAWWLVVFAGLSSAVHAMFFDRHQSEFISSKAGEPDYIGREIGRFGAEIRRIRFMRGAAIRVQLLRWYLAYLQLQKRLASAKDRNGPRSAGIRANSAPMLRLWSLLGPTTNRTLLIACALGGRIDVYLWAVAAAGNAWLLGVSLLQSRLRRTTDSAQGSASGGETR